MEDFKDLRSIIETIKNENPRKMKLLSFVVMSHGLEDDW